jgi:hypothetical protein
LESIGNPALVTETCLRLCDERVRSESTPRRDLLERALPPTQDVADLSKRICLLAGIADRWLDLSEAKKAKPLVQEARDLLPKIAVGLASWARCELAKAEARIDLPEALKLIEFKDVDPSNQKLCRAEIAYRVVATQPDEAERLFGEAVANNIYQDGLIRIIWQMAARDPARARRMAARLKRPEPPPSMLAANLTALISALYARALVATEPKAALAELEEFFDQFERATAADDRLWAWPTPAVVMAAFLLAIERLDPTLVPEHLWPALAARPSWTGAPEGRNLACLAMLASLVARYDREAADAVFAPVADELPSLTAVKDFQLDQHINPLFQAAVAYDPRAAAALVERLSEDSPEPPPLPSVPGPFRMHWPRYYKADARRAAAQALAWAIEHRRRQVAKCSSIPSILIYIIEYIYNKI